MKFNIKDMKNQNNQKIVSFQGKFNEDTLEGPVTQIVQGEKQRLFIKNKKVYLLKYFGLNSEIRYF